MAEETKIDWIAEVRKERTRLDAAGENASLGAGMRAAFRRLNFCPNCRGVGKVHSPRDFWGQSALLFVCSLCGGSGKWVPEAEKWRMGEQYEAWPQSAGGSP